MIEKGYSWAIGKSKKGASCPFLGVDNKCLIYKTRPQICRDYPQGAKCKRAEREQEEDRARRKEH